MKTTPAEIAALKARLALLEAINARLRRRLRRKRIATEPRPKGAVPRPL